MKLPLAGPRKVRPSRGARAAKIAIPVVYVVITVGLWWFRAQHIGRLQEFFSHGIVASARVTDRGEAYSKTSRGTLSWEFAVGGRSYSGSEEAPDRAYSNIQVGSDLTVTYLPSDPNQSLLGTISSQYMDQQNLIWKWALTAVSVLFAAIYLGHHEAYRRERELLRNGLIQHVKVRSVDVYSTNRASYRTVSFDYEWTDGNWRTNTAQFFADVPYGEKPGDLLPYIYTPGQPMFGMLVMRLSYAEPTSVEEEPNPWSDF